MRYNIIMSNPTSINVLLGQIIASDNPAQALANLKLIEIPKALEFIKQVQILRGQITIKTNDGMIELATDKGVIKAKIMQNTPLQVGDHVEIKINKGSPPQMAIIKLASRIITKESPTPNIMQNIGQNTGQNTGQISQDIKPQFIKPLQILSAEQLIAQNTIKIDLLTPQIVQKIVTPYIEKIDAILNPVTNLSMPLKIVITDKTPPIIITKQDISKTSPQPITELYLPPQAKPLDILPASKDLAQKPENIVASFKMNTPITELPLKIVAAQLVANPIAKPINTSMSPLEISVPPVFKEVSIEKITLPIAEVRHGDAFIKTTNEKAGETRAELVGATHDKNLPVIKIAIGTNNSEQYYALQTLVKDIPLSAEIELSITKSENITPASKTISAPQATPLSMPIIISQSSFISPDIWTVMQEISQILAQASPAAATTFGNIMPSPNAPAQLGSAAMFFLSAMRSGDVQSWLGERAVDILKRAGKSELITRLSGEFSSLSRMSSDGSTGEWRSLTLPLAWQNEIHKMDIHYRKEDGGSDDEEQKGGSKTRFVMDLNLSQIGKVQLDGLFIGKPNGAGRLDLILRTEQGFSETMKMEMRQKYKAALDETSFSGELNFQDKPDQWVNITPDAHSEFLEDV